MPDAIGYIRVSTAEQAGSGLGLEAQRRTLADACRARGLTLLEVFEDAGVSSVARSRPGLDAALAAVELHKGRVLVSAKLDRLARSLSGYSGLLERSRRRGWQLLALDAPDATTPQGEAMQGMAAIFAQLERQLTGQRTREALAAAKARGVQLGRRQVISEQLGKRILELHQRDGLGARGIARLLQADGTPPPDGASWHPTTVARFLTRHGAVLHRGRPRQRKGARRTIRRRPAVGVMPQPPA